MGVTLKKEDFIRIMYRIKNHDAISNDLDMVFDKYNIDRDFIDLFGLITMSDDIVIDLLETIFNDKDGTIQWWIYDCNWGETAEIFDTKDDSKSTVLDTLDKLYYYLMENN